MLLHEILNKTNVLDQPTLSIGKIASKHKVPKEYIQSQLKAGIRIEMEHTTHKDTAREIALDHLSEDPDYYKKLRKAKLEENEETLPSVEQAKKLLPQVLERVQKTYNNWDESDIDTYAGGGICHYIADDICSVLNDHGIDCATISCSHEQHVYVAGKFLEGIYSIDIPYQIYETGGGYNWKKISGVVFEPSDVVFYKVSNDTSEWDNYISESVSFDEIQIPRQGYKVERGGYKFQLSYDGANITVNVYPRDYQYDYSMNYIAYAVLDRERNNLFPIDLAVVDDDYKGRGIAKLIYDYLKELGFTVYRGKDQTGAGKKFWDKNRGKNVKIWEVTRNKVNKKMIHDLADKLGVPWNDAPNFLKMTKQLTGKSYLDNLNQSELNKVYNYLKSLKK